MGIPKFFRWLSERYPLVNQMMAEAEPPEFDNLYLDMNGIIHHCSHPFDDSTKNVLTEKEMFISIVHYVDRLLHIVKPRKLLFLAIDGVAPRAKMNQQRQRRFRSARDSAEALKQLEAKGQPLPKDRPFDSNCITPGTEFMHTLSEHLHFFIRKKLSEDNRWKKIKIIFSGHDVPGEGEHKIMEYIRHCKAQPSWDPNQTHCMYGLDADLIMLGLASHEPHFSLLRENVLTKQKRGTKVKITGETAQSDLEFHFLHLSMVREYLDVEFSALPMDFPYDLERVVDDYILMCFFVGNDFLPHSASFDIAEGGLNTMLGLYKTLLPSLGGYLVENATIQWPRLEKFIASLGKIERKLLEGVPIGDFFEEQANNDIENEKEFNSENEDEEKDAPKEEGAASSQPQPRSRALEKMILDSAEGEENDHDWKDLYYKERFEGKLSAEAREGTFAEFHRNLRQSYLEGLDWVMKYYFLGCVSWSWFYPYYYAPLFSDLVDLSSYTIQFSIGSPFTPYQQLLAVLPAASSRFLPPPYQNLMTNPVSPIIEFYPEDFKIDMTGKKNPWEGIVLVPFIDQARLLAASGTIPENALTQLERDRNKLGVAHEMLYDGQSHGRWTSPAPYLSDIQDSQISAVPYQLPPLAPGSNPFHLLPTTKTGLNAPSGIPTLKTSTFVATYVHAKVNVFGFPSKHDNLIIKLPDSQQHTAADPVITSLIGSKCYVNWPYLVEALIVGASDISCKYYSPQHVYNKSEPNKPVNNNNNSSNDGKATAPNEAASKPLDNVASPVSHEIKSISSSAEASGYFKKDAEWYQNKLLTKKGIDVGPIEVMLHVRLLEGVETGENGDRYKKYATTETQWPIQLHKPLSILSPDTRYVEASSVPLEIRFPPTLSVLYLGPQYTGCLGHVQLISADQTMIVAVDGIASEPRFGAKIAGQTAEPYYQMHQVARRLNISPRNLSKLTGSVYFEPGRFNLGLNIKFSGKNLQVPGYTRKLGDGPWEFSEKAIQLIADYKAKFPRVFELLDFGEEPFDTKDLMSPSPNPKSPVSKNGVPLRTSANQADPPTASPPSSTANPLAASTDLANGVTPTDTKEPGSPAAPTPHQIATSIQAWLRSQPSDSISKVPCGCDSMSQEGVKQVEAYVARLTATQKVLRNVSPSDIVGPRADPIPFTAEFMLGDRVVYALDNTPVPFGLRGTVVAIKGSTLDVVFDSDFVGGGTLDGTCTDFRGKNVPLNSIYNITRFGVKPHSAAPGNHPRYAPPQNRGWQNNQNPKNAHSPNPPPQRQQQTVQIAQQQQKQEQKQQEKQQEQEHLQKIQMQLQQQVQQLQIQSQQNQMDQSSQSSQPSQPLPAQSLQQPQREPHKAQHDTQSAHPHHKANRNQKAYKPKAQQPNNSGSPQLAPTSQVPTDSVDLAKIFNQVIGGDVTQSSPELTQAQSPQTQQPQQSQQSQAQLHPRQQRSQQRRQTKQQHSAPQTDPLLQPPQQQNQYQPQNHYQPQQYQPQNQYQPQQQTTEAKDGLTWQQQQLLGSNKRGGHQRNSRRGGHNNNNNNNNAMLAPPNSAFAPPNSAFAPPSGPALFVPAPYNSQPPSILPTPPMNPNIHTAPHQMQHMQLVPPPAYAPTHAQAHAPAHQHAQPHNQHHRSRPAHHSMHPPAHAAPPAHAPPAHAPPAHSPVAPAPAPFPQDQHGAIAHPHALQPYPVHAEQPAYAHHPAQPAQHNNNPAHSEGGALTWQQRDMMKTQGNRRGGRQMHYE